MAEFPRYLSKGQINNQQPSFLAPTDNTGQVVSQSGEKIGSTVQDAGVKWSNAIDTIQKTAAEANFKSGLLDIQQRAMDDPDYNNSDQYLKEIDKLKTDNLKGFSSKFAEQQMGIEFGYQSKVAAIQIQNLYNKKMIDVGQASAMKLLDMEVQNTSPDLQLRLGKILNSQVQSNIISHEQAYKLQREYTQKGIQYAAYSDPESFLQKEAKGEYADVDPKSLESLRNAANNILEKRKKENAELLEADQIQTVTSMAQRIAGGETTESMILALNDARSANLLTQADYDIFAKSLGVANNKESDSTVSLNLQNEYIKASLSGDAKDFRKFTLDVLNSKASLDANRFATYLKRTDPQFIELQKPKAKETWSGLAFLKNLVKNISLPVSVATNLYETFLAKAQAPNIHASEVPRIAREVAKSEALKQNPDLVGKEDITNISISQSRGAKTVYPGDTSGKADFKSKPSRVKYKPGDVVTVSGRQYKVIGITEEGKTEVEEIVT